VALFKQLGLSAFSTLFFIAVIVFCFIYVIRAIFAQRRISRVLVNFINNMTHEFKTPISTIFLASEALTKPAVLKEKSRLKRYGKIIQDESSRMRDQVEKILEMAALEEGDFEFNITSVDVHELIREAVDGFSLAVEKRNGILSVELGAGSHLIEGDAVHVRDVIHNLLDNAMKYTRENPEIVISTTNDADWIQLAIQDNGIGLRPEEQKRVFDKYYRVPTGNVHDVKGFGLGLNYVKLIVEGHKGTVSVKSEPGRGSVFTITLPLSKQTE
jgi:two-component system phosphate regulon sensor histidine kinase PhoR